MVLATILLVGCGSHPSKTMSKVLDAVPIGTTESKFKEVIEGEELVFSDTDVSIYKVTISTFNYVHHRRSDFRFFYFHKGILKQVDRGKRASDVKIEVTKGL